MKSNPKNTDFRNSLIKELLTVARIAQGKFHGPETGTFFTCKEVVFMKEVVAIKTLLWTVKGEVTSGKNCKCEKSSLPSPVDTPII